MLRVLLASDDRDLSFARLQELLGDEKLAEMAGEQSQHQPSDHAQADLIKAGLQVSVANLDTLADMMQSRARLGFYFDALVLLTIRPYPNRAQRLSQIATQIRGLNDSVCFPNGLRVKVIPIVLVDLVSLVMGVPIKKKDFESVADITWCYVQPVGLSLGEVVASALATWRADLFLELDYIGYAISFNELGEVEVDHILRRKRRESIFFDDTATLDSLRRSGCLRLPQDLLADFAPYRKLQFVLNKMRNLPSKQQEPILQQFLDENPVLIYRGLFERHWSQPLLRHPDPLRRDVIPDFILESGQAADSQWTEGDSEVLEIKTSERSVVERGKFTEFFRKAMEQLQLRYADYFSDPRTAPEQLRELGRILEKPRMALLIGRSLTEEDANILSDAKSKSEWNHIQIINYDDLFDVGMRQLELQKSISDGAQNL